MNESRIENLKIELDEAVAAQRDWHTPYNELIREVFNKSVLFFALSEQQFNPEDATSTPLISIKDFGGAPALYVFTDIEIATIWMKAYKAVCKDKNGKMYGLIGALQKEPCDFFSVFSIAKSFGAQKIMLDEGGRYVGIDLDLFIEQNNIDMKNIQMRLTEAEMKEIMANNESVSVRLPRIVAIPLAWD